MKSLLATYHIVRIRVAVKVLPQVSYFRVRLGQAGTC